ncbi:hypothetical protein ACS0TY_024403 [Phlomoides rotata]
MASLLCPPLNLPPKKVNDGNAGALAMKTLSKGDYMLFRKNRGLKEQFAAIKVKASLEADVLDKTVEAVDDKDGLTINEARPHDKLPYRGAWLWVGSEMIHLMELPNPDPFTGRPEHGGRDRHTCIAIRDVSKLKDILDKAGIPYTLSRSGRPAIFTRDPDTNALEFTEVD